MAKIVSWSLSQLNSYENCPYKYNEVKSKRIQDQFGLEAKEGIYIHEQLEKRLQNSTPLTGRLLGFEGLCKMIENAAGTLHPELQFCVTRELKPTKYKDWTFGWLRIVLDILKVNGTKAWIGDWKSGKPVTNYDQLELCSAVTFIFYPEVQEIKANYIYLKNKKLSETQTYVRADATKIWQKHLPRALDLERAWRENDFPTRTSGLCKSYCIVNKLGKCPDPDAPPYKVKN